MANDYCVEDTVVVYEIVRTGNLRSFEPAYRLAHVNEPAFESKDEAEDWIVNNGRRHADYIIVEAFRNRE